MKYAQTYQLQTKVYPYFFVINFKSCLFTEICVTFCEKSFKGEFILLSKILKKENSRMVLAMPKRMRLF